jgi:hypothetical protein
MGVILTGENRKKPLFILLEHRMGVEPMNTGFADQRVSHFATGAQSAVQSESHSGC